MGKDTIQNTSSSSGFSSGLTPTHNFDFRTITPSSGFIIDDIGGTIKANYMNGITSSSEGVVFTGGARSDEEHPYINLDDFELGNNVSFESYYKFDSNSASFSRLFGFGDGDGENSFWVAPANGCTWTITSSNNSQPARIDYTNNNLRDVLLNCTNELKDFFDISKWSFNLPINLSLIYTLLDRVKGVQTVENIEVVNKQGGEYSRFAYDVKGATKRNVVYPSYDPMIFEVKYPNSDIKGRITTL